MSNILLNTIKSSGSQLQILEPVTAPSLTVTVTDNALNLSSGAIQVAGGVAVSKDIFTNGNVITDTLRTSSGVGGDTHSLVLSSFGSTSVTSGRGAVIQMDGVDSASAGTLTAVGISEIRLLTGSGTPVERMSIDGSGATTFTGSVSMSTTLHVTGNSTMSGTLTVTGAVVTAPTFATSTAGTSTFDKMSIQNTTDTTSTTTGALMVAGGVGVAKAIYVGTSLSGLSGGITVASTVDSASVGIGSVVTSGGLSVAKTLYVGGSTRVTSTDDSSTPLTGAVVVSGGLGVIKSLSTGGPIRTLTGEATHWQLALGDGTPKWTVGLASTTHSLAILGSSSGLGLSIDNTSGNVTINSTHASTAISTLGGITVAKNVAIGGSTTISATVDTTDLSTGALQVSGGMAVTKTLRVGQLIDVIGTSAQLGDIQLLSSVDVTSTPIYGSTRATFLQTGFERATASFTPLIIAKYNSTVPIVGITEGTLYVHGTTGATTLSSGALQVSGGIAASAASYLSGVSLDTLTVRSTSIVLSGSKTLVSDVSGTLSLNPSGSFTALSLGSQATSLGGTADMTINGGKLVFGQVHQLTASGQWLFNYDGSVVQSAPSGTSKISIGGSLIEFFTGAINSAPTTRHVGIHQTAGVTIYTPLECQSTVVISSTINSSTTETGALTVAGSVSVAKSLNVGNNANFFAQVDIDGLTTLNNHLVITNTTESTSTSTGSIVTTGGIGVKLNVSVGGDLLVSGTQTFTGDTTFGGHLLFLDTTDTTVLGTGSLVLSGGLSVAKGLAIGGAATLASSMSVAGQVTLTNTTTSGSSSTGALVVSGGLGVGEKLFVNNNISTSANLSVGGNSTISGSVNLGTGSLNISSAVDILTVKSNTPGMTLAALGTAANTAYSNLFTMFSLGATLLDINHEALQFSTLSTDGFTILTRAAGTGAVRKLVIQTGTNTGQLTLHTNGAIEASPSLSVSGSVNPTKSNQTSTALAVPNGTLLMGDSVLFASDAPTGAIPTTTSRSTGSRVVLYPNTTASSVDTAMGIDSSYNAWIATQSAARFFSGTVETLKVTRSALMVATSVQIGNLSGSASGSTSMKIQGASSGSIQVSPNDETGGAVSIQFASDSSMTQNGTMGSLWSFGRNVNGSGLTTMALSMSGPSGETTVQFWDNSGNLFLNSTTQAASGSVGALVVSGGANIAKDVLVGGNLNVTGTINGAFTGTSLTLSDTTQSTSTSTGTLIVSGGTAVAKNLHVGGNVVLPTGNLMVSTGNISVSGTSTLTGSVTIQNTEDSTSLITGSLITAGGLTVTKTLYANGAINAVGQIIQLGDAFITNDATNGLYLIPPNTSAGVKIRNSGNTASLVTITDSGPMDISTTVRILATGNSTSSLTGALTLAGGMGIVKDVHIGGTLSAETGAIITGSSLVDKVLQISGAADIALARAIEVTYPNLSAGNMTTIGIGKNSSVKNMSVIGFKYSGDQSNSNLMTLGVAGTEGIIGVWGNGSVSIGSIASVPSRTLSVTGSAEMTGVLYITDTSQSVGTTTGALIISGGGAIAKNLYVGASLDVNSSSLFRSSVQFSSTVSITDTTETNSLGQGALVLSGGLSVAKTAYFGTELHIIGGLYGAAAYFDGAITITSTTQSASTTTGSIITAGGAAIAKNLYLGGNLTMTSSSALITTQYLTVTDNTISTSPSTGAVKITGGIGLQGNMYVGGTINVMNTTQSTSYTSGALVLQGGIGLTGNLYSNGTIVASGAITSTSDERLKTNVEELPTGALDAIRNIRTVSYEFKGSPIEAPEDEPSQYAYGPTMLNQYMGVLAQQLEQVVPSVVFKSHDINKTRSVDYARLTVVLIKAVQELTAEVEELKKQLQ